MKRILFLVPRMNIGGAETYVYTAAKELRTRGYEVFLASGGGRLADELKAAGIRTFFSRSGRAGSYPSGAFHPS